jgi:uncharacterized protein (DUF433 family)
MLPVIDWSQCPVVESDPGKLGGAWTLRGTRIPIEMLFVNLASGATVEDFLNWFEGITREQIVEVLEFAAKGSRTPEQSAVQHQPAPA